MSTEEITLHTQIEQFSKQIDDVQNLFQQITSKKNNERNNERNTTENELINENENIILIPINKFNWCNCIKLYCSLFIIIYFLLVSIMTYILYFIDLE